MKQDGYFLKVVKDNAAILLNQLEKKII